MQMVFHHDGMVAGCVVPVKSAPLRLDNAEADEQGLFDLTQGGGLETPQPLYQVALVD